MYIDIISQIGAVLSVFGYIGTIATYASNDELWNIPGICLVNAALALLIPAVIKVINEWISFDGTLCVATAIVIQVSWLAAFTWMSLQAVHMIRAFVLTNWQTPLGHPLNRKKFAKVSLAHALIGWGLPTVYTAVLLYFHFCDACLPGEAEFRFGKDVNSTKDYCWTRNSIFADHMSVDPILILLVFNIVALLSIMTAIIRKRMVTRKAAGRDLKKEMATNLLILTKLSVSLGVTWIPVLLNRIFPNPTFILIHLLINAWLGVIIFILFATTQRIRRFWRDRLQGFFLTKANDTSSDLYQLRDSSGSGRIEVIT